MVILANLRGINLFSSPPTNPRISDPNPNSKPPSPPIPIPKYPPKIPKTLKPSQNLQHPPPQSSSPAFKTFHRRTKYYKPVKDGEIASVGDRSVVVGESGVSYKLPGAPFEFQFSYSETPKVKPVAIREPAFLPFAPPTMNRPWTGKAPLKKSKKNIPLFDSFDPPPPGMKGVKHVEMPGPFQFGKYPQEGKTREEILGERLTRAEVRMLVKPHLSHNRQVNLGRDGLTHNMLELVHSHWKRQRVCKVRCLGVPTVDMDNVCYHLEEKTGGKIIHRIGGVIYLFRGRNYNYRTRPQYPVMLWKPAAPVYPKLIQDVPEGLTKYEANVFRKQGKKLLPLCKLAKNGVYINLVKDVRDAFEGSPLAKVNCQGMDASDYKRIGAKLKELVPCVLLSFDDEQILMWRGREWKSMYPEDPPLVSDSHAFGESGSVMQGQSPEMPVSSPRMLSLWKRALESSKALLLDETVLAPDALLEKVEAFSGMSQLTEHSYPAIIISNKEGGDNSSTTDQEDEAESFADDDYNDNEFDVYEDTDGLFQNVESVPQGSLPIDTLTERLSLD